ncbi:MAG: response regulator [Candidatus Omnitrophota bacterium]|nr:response regulator [Candidatus Omnitrophota bacterium]
MNNVNPAVKKIMVIDDEDDILKLTKTRLEANGFKVVTLESGEGAIEFTESEKPDLILLDIVMPGKDGYAVCKELKANQSTCRIPIVIFTAQYPKEEDVMIKSAITCADDYILKPFEGQELLAKIKLLIK